MRRIASIPLACAVVLFLAAPASADHPGKSGPFPHVTHLEVKGMVTKIHPSMVVVQPEYGLRPRTISMLKAERIGVHDTKIGDELMLVVDEGNVLVDAHKAGMPAAGHRTSPGPCSTPISTGRRSNSQPRRGSRALRWTRLRAASSLSLGKARPSRWSWMKPMW